MMIERSPDAGGSQLVEDIALVAPILETLEVTVKPRADVAVPLPDDHSPAGSGKPDRASKSGWPSADDRDRLRLFVSRVHTTLKRAHTSRHGSKT